MWSGRKLIPLSCADLLQTFCRGLQANKALWHRRFADLSDPEDLFH